MRVSRSGGWMSVISPHSKRLRSRSSSVAMPLRLDVRDQPPLEAAPQSLLERRDVAWRPVGGEHDLRAGLVQRVEGVEELLLEALLAFEELDVVDEQDVVRAVALLEPLDPLVAERVDEVVDER